MRTRGVMRAALVALVALSAPAGCAFSSYQSAKMLPQGGTQVGAALSAYSYNSDGGSGDTTGFEGFASHGLSDRFELGGKLTYMNEADTNVFSILAAPKVSLVPNVLAFTAQSGAVLVDGDGGDNGWIAMPGLTFTQTFSEMFQLDASGKLVAMFPDNFDDSNFGFAVNVGLKVSLPGTRFGFMPELGIMYDDDTEDGGYFMQLGIALLWQLGPLPAPAPAP